MGNGAITVQNGGLLWKIVSGCLALVLALAAIVWGDRDQDIAQLKANQATIQQNVTRNTTRNEEIMRSLERNEKALARIESKLDQIEQRK